MPVQEKNIKIVVERINKEELSSSFFKPINIVKRLKIKYNIVSLKESDKMLELEENTRLLETLKNKLQELGESL